MMREKLRDWYPMTTLVTLAAVAVVAWMLLGGDSSAQPGTILAGVSADALNEGGIHLTDATDNPAISESAAGAAAGAQFGSTEVLETELATMTSPLYPDGRLVWAVSLTPAAYRAPSCGSALRACPSVSPVFVVVFIDANTGLFLESLAMAVPITPEPTGETSPTIYNSPTPNRNLQLTGITNDDLDRLGIVVSVTDETPSISVSEAEALAQQEFGPGPILESILANVTGPSYGDLRLVWLVNMDPAYFADQPMGCNIPPVNTPVGQPPCEPTFARFHVVVVDATTGDFLEAFESGATWTPTPDPSPSPNAG